MATTKFINNADTAVETSINTLCMMRPYLKVIENTNVVVNTDIDSTKVLVICGGGAGHEPSQVGFVGPNWLSAGVAGGVFASPPVAHVTAAIDYLHKRQGPNGPGILIVVTNYAGDLLNFGFAIQEAKERGISIEMVLSADDVCFGVSDITRRRGIAGTVILNKVACSAASKGKSLSEIKELSERISNGMRSLGASLSSCSLPGSKATSVVPEGFVEVGLGIHGEQGMCQMPFDGAKPLVEHMMEILLGCGEKNSIGIDSDWKGAKVAVLVNNLGSTTDIEMGIITQEALQYIKNAGIEVVGLSVGRYMTALEMHGFSLTLLRFTCQEDISYLFDEKQAEYLRFIVPKYEVNSLPGPRSAIQLAQEGQSKPESNGVLCNVITRVFLRIRDAEEELNDLDAAVGDGDLGSGMKRAATAALELVPYLPLENDVKKSFVLLAKGVADACGGTSGPLYGAFLLGVAAAVTPASAAAVAGGAVAAIRAGLAAGSAEVQRIGRARVGDRTMVDVLEAVVRSPGVGAAASLAELAGACVAAARAGAANTAQLPAKHGRSRYLQGREVGRKDPGAELVVMWISAAAETVLEEKSKL